MNGGGAGGYEEGGYGERGAGRVRRGGIYVYIRIYMLYIYIYISKMIIFMNMVITRAKNRSPDLVLTSFDGKFTEKKNEIPLGAHRPPYTSNYSILGI